MFINVGAGSKPAQYPYTLTGFLSLESLFQHAKLDPTHKAADLEDSIVPAAVLFGWRWDLYSVVEYWRAYKPRDNLSRCLV